MNKVRIDDFRVKQNAKLELKKRPTKVDAVYESKADYLKLLAKQTSELAHLQNLQYAHDRYALLLIFQAMDAAGKDGAIKHVMSGINPAGCEITSFKQPSQDELQHDFLWRTTKRLPERGRIGIFNRSYYEEVLVVRVHPDILRAQHLPDELHNDHDIWKERYRSIVDLERHLHRNGTRIAKFFLNISKNEQRKRFVARIDDPEKNWKFNVGDVRDRKHWKDYMKAYEACLEATSTDEAPWYVVPADDKLNARLIISEIITHTLKGLKMKYPEATPEHQTELQTLRKQLEKNGEKK